MSNRYWSSLTSIRSAIHSAGTSFAFWNCEVGYETEMVASPHSVRRFVKDLLAGSDLERGSTMLTTAHEEVVDPSVRPVPIRQRHQRILKGEGRTWFM
jgi:hypothetical protein